MRSLTATALVVFVLFGVFGGIGLVCGQSMAPSFQDGDLVLIWRLDGHYTHGDVIFFKRDVGEGELIKRVVAVPGDTVDADVGDRLTVNGGVLEDTYAKPGVAYPLTPMEDEYFVLGDNHSAAADSRNFGTVKKHDIIGKVILVVRAQPF